MSKIARRFIELVRQTGVDVDYIQWHMQKSGKSLDELINIAWLARASMRALGKMK